VAEASAPLRHLVPVLGDQLDLHASGFDGFDPARDAVWMAEVAEESTHVWSSQPRTALFLAAMRHFAQALAAAGRPLHYTALDAPGNRGSLAAQLAADIARLRPQALVMTAPGDWRVLMALREAVAAGQQVYWVCPLVEESEHLDLQNATATHAELAALMTAAVPGAPGGAMVGLLHGRMPPAEKAAVMSLFSAGTMKLLVATTVIEVGVDVPNASLMVIEHAERFGLAQLHQLRGRVGRGAAASVCVLLYTAPLSPTGKTRLKAMAETTDGFEIARRDLEIRGPGEFMGARQSGDALLRFADLATDEPLLQQARAAAVRLLAEHPARAQQQVDRWLGAKTEFLKA